MLVELKSVGGFTGPIGAQVLHIITEQLDNYNALRIEKLVKDVNVFALPDKMRLANPRPWDFLYTLTIDDGHSQRTVEFHKEQASAALQELVDFIENMEVR